MGRASHQARGPAGFAVVTAALVRLLEETGASQTSQASHSRFLARQALTQALAGWQAACTPDELARALAPRVETAESEGGTSSLAIGPQTCSEGRRVRRCAELGGEEGPKRRRRGDAEEGTQRRGRRGGDAEPKRRPPGSPRPVPTWAEYECVLRGTLARLRARCPFGDRGPVAHHFISVRTLSVPAAGLSSLSSLASLASLASLVIMGAGSQLSALRTWCEGE